MHFTNLFTVLFSIVYYGRRLLYKKVMTKIKLFQLRLFRTIRRQIQNELKKEISKKQSKVKN